MSNPSMKPIKIILLGDSGVGKSSIIQRYSEDKFDDNLAATYTSSFIEKDIIINWQKVKLELWDTVGQEEFRSLTQIFVKNSKIAILVYNVTSKPSFESLNYWYDFIKRQLDPDVVYGLVGNKIDLILEEGYEEEVTQEEAKEYSRKMNATFALVSAKESITEINLVINELVSRYLENKDSNIDNTNSTIHLDDAQNTSNNKSECCIGKNKEKEIKINTVFLGVNGVGKTAIIKSIKGNNQNISDLPHTKKSYKEYISYNKNGQNITVILKDTNCSESQNDIFINKINDYENFFLVFNVYKKNTLYELENWIKKINKRNRTYLLGYFNEKTENKDNDFDYENEAQIFAQKYGIEYENITIDDIYKIKVIILDNINNYMTNIGL